MHPAPLRPSVQSAHAARPEPFGCSERAHVSPEPVRHCCQRGRLLFAVQFTQHESIRTSERPFLWGWSSGIQHP